MSNNNTVPEGYEYLSQGEQVAVSLASTVPAILSILGSSAIIHMILQDWNTKKKKTKYRLLLCLSIADVMNSLWFVAWPVPFPKDFPGIWGAVGNRASCRASGFFLQMGCMGAFYNAALCHYFYIVLCRGVSEKEFAGRHEPIIHVVCWGFPIITASLGLFLDHYGPGALGCWVYTEPRLCLANDDIDCVNGQHALLWAWIYQGGPLCLLLGYIGFAMAKIYQKIRSVSQKAERWSLSLPTRDAKMAGADDDKRKNDMTSKSFESSDLSLPSKSSTTCSKKSKHGRTKHAERTKEAGAQAFLYIGAYLATHMWAFVVFHMDLYVAEIPSVLFMIQNISWPLQGALNLFVFLRPRTHTLRKQDKSLNYWIAVYISLFHYDEANPKRSSDQWHKKKNPNNNNPLVLTLEKHNNLVSGLSSLHDHDVDHHVYFYNDVVDLDEDPPIPPFCHIDPEGEDSSKNQMVDDDDD